MNDVIVLRINIGLLLLVFAALWLADESELAMGVLVSGVLLLVNLWGWMWSLKTLLSIVRDGGNPLGVTMFFSMKFVVLATCMIAIMLVYQPIVLAISNSIVVLSLILSLLIVELRGS